MKFLTKLIRISSPYFSVLTSWIVVNLRSGRWQARTHFTLPGMGLTTKRSMTNPGWGRGWGSGECRWARSWLLRKGWWRPWCIWWSSGRFLEVGQVLQGLQGRSWLHREPSTLQWPQWGCWEALWQPDRASWWTAASWQTAGLHRARPAWATPDLLWNSWWSRNVEVGNRKMTLSYLSFFLTSTKETLDPDFLTYPALGQSISFQAENRAPSIARANHLTANGPHSKSTLSNPAGPTALFGIHLLNLQTPFACLSHTSPSFFPHFWLFFCRGVASPLFSLVGGPSLLF